MRVRDCPAAVNGNDRRHQAPGHPAWEGSKDAARCVGYLTKYLTKQVGECHHAETGAARAHAARLAEALRYEPCSRCANWLRYGIQPKNARPRLVPGRCKSKRRRLRLGEWIDPRPGQVPLSVAAADWLGSRGSVKRRTRETDEAAWRNYVQPRFGNWPVASITAAEVSSWVGSLVAPRPGAVHRDSRAGHTAIHLGLRDGGRTHTAQCRGEVYSLTEACKGRCRDVVPVMALAGR